MAELGGDAPFHARKPYAVICNHPAAVRGIILRRAHDKRRTEGGTVSEACETPCREEGKKVFRL